MLDLMTENFDQQHPAGQAPQPGAPQPGAPEPQRSGWAAPAAPGAAQPQTSASAPSADAAASTAQLPAYGPPWSQTIPPAQPAIPPTQPAQPGPPRTPGRGARVAIGAAAAVAIALGAGGVGGFVGYALHPEISPLQTTASAPQDAAPVVDRSSLASIAAQIQPTVVSVATNSGEGSGVVISADGYIVTNNHVVAGARNVRVTFNSGKQVPVTVVGTDPKTDVAVLKADATDLRFASWGNSDDVQVGDTVLAVGSPLGLQGSVTAGIVSALQRTITVGDQGSPFGQTGPQTTIGDAIQTDAPINPGNSGGALVNTKGELIGINTAIATSGSTGNIGVGFAISANRAKVVTEQIIKGEKVSHPYLGVSIGDAENGGAQIQEVEPGSPADQAGLRAGDVVTKVNDRGISGRESLVGAIQSSTVGESLILTVIRDGNEQTITATVGEQP